MTFTLDSAVSANFSQEGTDMIGYLVDNFGFQSTMGFLVHYTALDHGEVETITGRDGRVLTLTGDASGSCKWNLSAF